jgi:formiminotetrahydrofolate cyclodeaminase
VETLELAVEVVELGNLNAISDGASGAAQARAALTGAGYNVRINLVGLKDQVTAGAMLAELAGLEAQAARLEERVRLALKERGGMPLA